MIQIFLNNEALDIDTEAVVTFKKAQLLNGIQGQYSFSNNFNLKDSSKNRRLLGINYLPNSKAKSMTEGYSVDVILNGCIFLKRQKLKVQKETQGAIPVYLVFTDSFLVAKAKEVLMNQIPLGVVYTKGFTDFLIYNNDLRPLYRAAPISAQDQSGMIVVEEVPVLLNVKELVLKAITFLGYAYTGDILTDANIGRYYTNSNVGVYGPDGTPRFAATMTVYDFIIDFLETFNGYIEVSDSSRSLGIYLWKNIETIKANFVDYSAKFVNYKEYAFEGGLARTNTLSYADSPDFYNGFFNNNKSIVEKSDYLNSNFGAGNLRLFADQDIEEDGTILPRVIGEATEPQTMNLFRFEEVLTSMPVYIEGILDYHLMYKAFSPNILEIWQLFHQPYTANIAQPTIGQLDFRYDAIFLANFKMTEVFFVKQLSTYWLPIEQNFTAKKDGVKIKCLMIGKTAVDIPVVFDQNLKVSFYGDVFILDVDLLYSAQNVSPPAVMTITGADLTKNSIFINGTQVLAFPTAIDVSMAFELKISNVEPDNVLSNSDINFTFTSEQGGTSRVGKINVAHTGRANFLSEFKSEEGTVFTYGQDDVNRFDRFLNYSGKITSPINIADTFAPSVGDVETEAEAVGFFKILEFDRASFVTVGFTAENIQVHASNRGGTARASTNVYFYLYKNGAYFMTVYTAGASENNRDGSRTIDYPNIAISKTFNVNAGDSISMSIYIAAKEEDKAGAGTMDGSASFKNINWTFQLSEQL